MKSAGLALIGTAILAGAPLGGQNAPFVFEGLRGDWEGVGTLMGRDARFTMSWQHEGGFAVLRFTNAFVDTAGGVTPVLSATAVYRTAADLPEAVWLDSRGQTIEIRWTATDSALVADWTASRESGRTTYRVLSRDAVEVVDEVWSGDELRTFATARYRRSGPGTAGPAVNGRVENLRIRRAKRGPMDPANELRVVPRTGIETNPDGGGRRQVTIIEKERAGA